MVDAPAPRPYFVPSGLDFDTLPEGLKLAIREIVDPAYSELVLGAADALERAAAVSFVHILWLELLDQQGLGTQIARHLPKGGTVTELVFEDDFNAHLRLLGAKHKAAAFLLRLREFRAKQHVSVAPWLRGLSPRMPAAPPDGSSNTSPEG